MSDDDAAIRRQPTLSSAFHSSVGPSSLAGHTTYHSADCGTDHSLVCSKIRLLPKKIHHNKQVRKPRINTTKMQYPEKVEEFAKSLEDAQSADSAAEKWDHLQETNQKTAFATFGRKTSSEP
ncbi:hypothetical protein ACOMHN_039437 [Nucella lapillus]